MEEEIKFEKALVELEKIVEELESGKLSLDEALKRYEEGVKLSRACTKKLTEAERKIEILSETLNNMTSIELEDEDSKKSSKKKSKKSKSEGEDDFLL